MLLLVWELFGWGGIFVLWWEVILRSPPWKETASRYPPLILYQSSGYCDSGQPDLVIPIVSTSLIIVSIYIIFKKEGKRRQIGNTWPSLTTAIQVSALFIWYNSENLFMTIVTRNLYFLICTAIFRNTARNVILSNISIANSTWLKPYIWSIKPQIIVVIYDSEYKDVHDRISMRSTGNLTNSVLLLLRNSLRVYVKHDSDD